MNRWKDWLDQAERDLKRAQLDVEHGFYEWACFTAQQSAEKAIKALGMRFGVDLWGHSLTAMLRVLEENLEIPNNIERLAKLLDKYYIPTRYPNGFASGKPADYFTLEEAEEAVDAAREILRFCKGCIDRQRGNSE